MRCKPARHVTGAAQVLLPLLPGETGLRENLTERVAIDVLDLHASTHQLLVDPGGDGGLARAGQTGEPQHRRHRPSSVLELDGLAGTGSRLSLVRAGHGTGPSHPHSPITKLVFRRSGLL